MKIFSGTSNPQLSKEICHYLNIEPGKIIVTSFKDGETRIEILEDVNSLDVFVLQSTCPPVNNNLIQLLLIIDALKRAGARKIIAVIPYYGYGRQDKKAKSNEPLSAKLVADFITRAGASWVISIDLHNSQIKNYFNIPVHDISVFPLLLKNGEKKFGHNYTIVAPDIGAIEKAHSYAKYLGVGLAIINKKRSQPNFVKMNDILGNVKNKIAVLLDDMVDTGNTLIEAASILKKHGALKIFACTTHPVFSSPAIDKIQLSCLDYLYVSNTIPLSQKAKKCPKIIVLSIAKILSDSIKNTANFRQEF